LSFRPYARWVQVELDAARRSIWKAQDERDEMHKLCNARERELDALRDDKLRLQVRLFSV
jgi:hypothetical protein